MLTVLTATYNRAHLLPRLYSSLCSQTVKHFEWIVVDDGSIDGTSELIACYRRSSDFPVRYVRQENQGKQSAINSGVRIAKAGWVLIADSDDLLMADAVEVALAELAELSAQGEVAGCCFRKAHLDGRLVGRRILGDGGKRRMTSTEAGQLFEGDLAYVFSTSYLRMYAFPVIPTEKFIPEQFIWNKISESAPVYFYFERVVYLCEYLDDGYSRNFKRTLKCNPLGFLIFYITQIRREKRVFGKLKCVVRSLQCAIYAVIKG